MLLGIAWISVRYAPDFKHMGLSLKRLIPNVGLGLAAAAMALPIVALVSAAVSEGLKAEYDHPLIIELKKEGTVSAYLLAVFLRGASGAAGRRVFLSRLAAGLVGVGAVELARMVVATGSQLAPSAWLDFGRDR